MTTEEINSFRLRIERDIAELYKSAESIKNEIRTSAETSSPPLRDSLDCARDERNLKSQIDVYNHTTSRVTELNNALARIAEGNFGVCLQCGQYIEPKRLLVYPGACLCINCQELSEARDGQTRFFISAGGTRYSQSFQKIKETVE